MQTITEILSNLRLAHYHGQPFRTFPTEMPQVFNGKIFFVYSIFD